MTKGQMTKRELLMAKSPKGLSCSQTNEVSSRDEVDSEVVDRTAHSELEANRSPKASVSVVDRSKFKNAMGAWVTKQLFIENIIDRSADDFMSVYTLKGHDHVYRGTTYPSLRRLYIESSDPTEYNFAQQHLGGWEHWKAICGQGWFQEYLREWREELEVKLRAEALVRIRQTAANPSRDALQANRLLLSAGWRTSDDKSGVGRPTKAKIKAEADKLFAEKEEFSEDFKRIFQ